MSDPLDYDLRRDRTLLEANGDGTHALDRERARRLARGMRMVGERPPYQEVSTCIGRLWEGSPDGITFHSLRRTYAALRAELGEHPAVTAAQMGHRDPG